MKKGTPILSAESIFNRLKKYIVGAIEEKQMHRGNALILSMCIIYQKHEYRVSLIKHTNVSRISIFANTVSMISIQSALVTTAGSGVIHEELYPMFSKDFNEEAYPKEKFDTIFTMVNQRLPKDLRIDYPLRHVMAEAQVA